MSLQTNTFFWHDYETFGISPRTHRPAQFAGIRTDMDLNEMGDPVMLYCQPTADSLLPDLESCFVTGITPQKCENLGITERDFAAKIEAELALPGTIGVGYNSIAFDDEFTRFLFWRNLIDPYAREWQNGCSRWDILNVVRGVFAFFPEALNFPKDAEGVVQFKLDLLTQANHLLHDHAHDALSDARATLGLARLVKKAQPKFFDFCLNLRDKNFVRNQLSLEDKKPLLHVSRMYGTERSCLALVWPLAEHPTNKNEVIVWDLSFDPSILLDLTPAQIQQRIFTRKEDLPENTPRLPLKTISINKSPFVLGDLRVLSAARREQLNMDFDTIFKHAEIAQTLKLAPYLWRDVYAREKFEALDVDEDLYGGFLEKSDRYLLNRLRFMGAEKLKREKPVFQDVRLEELFFRYRARNFPHILNPAEATRWELFCNSKIESQSEKFWQTWDELNQKGTDLQKNLLEEIKGWLNDRGVQKN